MKHITVPLRDFALPAPRTGSIEAHSGYGPSATDGQEIHHRVQKKRAKADPLYQAEVPVSGQFDRGGYRFQIDGRMDGIFRHDPPRIEEIKSGFNISELSCRLKDNPMDHPYCLQLLTYGYLYWLEQRIFPTLSFHLVSSRNKESCDLELSLNLLLYEKWLELRLDELVLEARQAEKRAARRRKAAFGFAFPFANPRPGQIELMQTIEEDMAEGNPMLIQAPTGLGKTVGVLYPVLREALSRGQRVEFNTPFPKVLRKLLIIPQISTKFAHRERNYAKIANAVQRITALRRGNYFVFLPSFEFLERVAVLFQPPEGFMVLRQERGMKASHVEAVLDTLRARSVPTIVFAVQGGSFSEGMDYAGEMVIGAFVVGPPLPNYDLEREQMREYYQRQYGAGFDYAYTIPAMAKAIQAAGRVIRSETDRGLIVLMDSRFIESSYSRSMPVDWFETDVKELVSDSILREVAEFWAA